MIKYWFRPKVFKSGYYCFREHRASCQSRFIVCVLFASYSWTTGVSIRQMRSDNDLHC